MKKFTITTLCIAMVFSIVLAGVVGYGNAHTALADTETTDTAYRNSDAYVFLTDFISECGTRSGSLKEENAARYLQERFNEVLSSAGVNVTATLVPYNAEYIAYNVVVSLKSSVATDSRIVIGAHYDSTGEGANDNASGITALYLVLKQIVGQTLPFNVDIVAFGGEEQGMLGSYAYVGKLTATERENILVMFNFDSIANGDNLYVQCENKSTALAKLILKNNSEGVKLQEKPYAVGVYPMDWLGYGYYESVQGSDHTPFRLQSIPVAHFFSGNFVAWDYVESTDSAKNVMNTNADTMTNLELTNGSALVDKIETVAQTVTNTILSADFMSVASNARKDLINNNLFFNSWWPRIAVVAIVLVLVIFAIVYYRKLVKKSILGTAEVRTDTLFSSPDADDIFSFDNNGATNNSTTNAKGDNSVNSDGDIDDIFTFKK